MELSLETLENTLNPVQLGAVVHTDGPQLILAGAGSGKTRVLTYKIAWLLQQDPGLAGRILAVTFTNKAAGEMRQRVTRFLNQSLFIPWLGTFHSVCARVMRMHGSELGYQDNFTIYDKEDQKSFIRKLLKKEHEESIQPDLLMSRINHFKNIHQMPSRAAAEACTRDEERLAYLYGRYQKELLQNNAMDFGDLISNTIRLLQEVPGYQEKFRRKFQYILIDEFQDTNKAQFELIRLFLADHCNITAVGDEDQSIYGWRGADISNILSFQKIYKGAEVVKMEENYRSTSNIISLAASVIRNNSQRLGKNIWTSNEAGCKVAVREYENESSEAEETILAISRDKTYPPEETAVFYRTNAQSRLFETNLRRFNIPYVVYGGMRFYDRKEVKDVLAYLRVITNSKDSVSLGRIINIPRRGIGSKTVEHFADQALSEGISLYDAMARSVQDSGDAAADKKIRPFIGLIASLATLEDTMGAGDMVEEVIEKTGYRAFLESDEAGEAQDRLNNVSELVSAAREFENRNPESGLEGFLQEISLFTQADEVEGRSGSVTLMTIHSAKGLEFKKVYITGLEENLFPLLRNGDESGLEEERRLFYVAVTRAERSLTLSYARSRRTWGYSVVTEPSRFFKEADPQFLEFGGKSACKSVEKSSAPGSGRYYEPIDDATFSDGERPSGLYESGRKVFHDRFGEGRILKNEGKGNSLRIFVRFKDGICRKLAPEFAKIKVLE